jgi:two-component system, cell cycle response regulator DivK
MKTLLLVEDQLEFRAILSTYLTGQGYRVLTAADGEEGLRMARETQPDMILLDHSLPFRSGLEIADALRSDPGTAALPILLITAHPYGALGKRAAALGCAGFLSKPCDPRRVLDEVRRISA